MGQLKYKGYVGSVEYSEEDGCLYGKVQGMRKDCITYEGYDVNELRRDFEGAIGQSSMVSAQSNKGICIVRKANGDVCKVVVR